MLLDSVLFYLFAILILGSSILMITRRNVVYAAVWLINALIGTAGLFLLQGAEFLAGVQVIVYIGGITVLYLFVIMLVPLREEMLQRRFASQGWLAVACSTLLLGLVSVFLFRGRGLVPLRGDRSARGARHGDDKLPAGRPAAVFTVSVAF